MRVKEKMEDRVFDYIQYKKWSESEPEIDYSQHIKNCLAIAIQEELSETQSLYFQMYHIHGNTIAEIADVVGVNKSTVSRTLTAAHKNIAKVMRYSSPYLLHKQKQKTNRRMKRE